MYAELRGITHVRTSAGNSGHVSIFVVHENGRFGNLQIRFWQLEGLEGLCY